MNELRIQILGQTGAGKTTISKFITTHLRLHGFDVENVDFEAGEMPGSDMAKYLGALAPKTKVTIDTKQLGPEPTVNGAGVSEKTSGFVPPPKHDGPTFAELEQGELFEFVHEPDVFRAKIGADRCRIATHAVSSPTTVGNTAFPVVRRFRRRVLFSQVSVGEKFAAQISPGAAAVVMEKRNAAYATDVRNPVANAYLSADTLVRVDGPGEFNSLAGSLEPGELFAFDLAGDWHVRVRVGDKSPEGHVTSTHLSDPTSAEDTPFVCAADRHVYRLRPMLFSDLPIGVKFFVRRDRERGHDLACLKTSKSSFLRDGINIEAANLEDPDPTVVPIV